MNSKCATWMNEDSFLCRMKHYVISLGGYLGDSKNTVAAETSLKIISKPGRVWQGGHSVGPFMLLVSGSQSRPGRVQGARSK